MILNHCTIDFKPYDIWDLYPNANFKNRRLILGKCPKCKKDVVLLIEERKADGREFRQTEIGAESINLVDRCSGEIIYKSSDFKVKKGKPSGIITYYENKEIHNNQGKIVSIRVRRCDFFGQKELYKEVAI